MKLKSTRDAYGEALLKLGGNNDNIVALDADLSISTYTKRFADKYPGRFFNVGCAEQNLIGVAAGFAIAGKIVFASTYSIFMCRAWEQIRNTVSFDNLNVNIAATHAGLTIGPDGASHQSLEDLSLMRVIPNMTVIVPSDALEAEKAVTEVASHKGSTYIRLNRINTPVIFDDDYDFTIGKAVKLTDGNDLAIIATGTMVHKALEASEILKMMNIDSCVVNLHTIKPIDENTIIRIAKETCAVITVEEHSIYGGLGGAVAEILGQNYPVPMKIIGVNCVFGESGEYDQLLTKHGLTATNIVKSAIELLNKMD